MPGSRQDIDEILKQHPSWEDFNRPEPKLYFVAKGGLDFSAWHDAMSEVSSRISSVLLRTTLVGQQMKELQETVKKLKIRDRESIAEFRALKERVARLEKSVDIEEEFGVMEDAEINSTLAQLSTWYRLADSADITEFLQSRRFLITPLIEAPRILRKYFKCEHQLSLRLVSGPEYEGYQRLFLRIHAEYPIELALDALDCVTKEWLYAQPRQVRAALNFDLAFK